MHTFSQVYLQWLLHGGPLRGMISEFRSNYSKYPFSSYYHHTHFSFSIDLTFSYINVAILQYNALKYRRQHYWVLETELHFCLSDISVRMIGTLPICVLQNTKFSRPKIFLCFEIRQNIYNFLEFLWENRPISLFRHIGPPRFQRIWCKLNTSTLQISSLKWYIHELNYTSYS